MQQKKKRQQKSVNEGSRAANLFKHVVDGLDLFFTVGYRPQKVLLYGMDGIHRMRKAEERKLQREAMRRLEKRKLLKIEKRADQYFVSLTEKGAKEYLRLKVLDSDLYEDGHECLVVFDIPETQRKLRKALRDFLSEAGFIPIQRSVWISQFNAGEAIGELLNKKGQKRWVRIYEVREL